jgi:hypothetical protein
MTVIKFALRLRKRLHLYTDRGKERRPVATHLIRQRGRDARERVPAVTPHDK